jgi:hypothetical protein
MVKHTCEICNKIFEKKSHFIQHLNKKKSCAEIKNEKPKKKSKILNLPQKSSKNPQFTSKILNLNKKKSYKLENSENSDNSDKFVCKYCNKNFSRNDNLFRHINNSCKIRKIQEEEKEKIFIELLKQNELIKKQNEELKNQNNEFRSEIEDLKRKVNVKNIKNIKISNNLIKNQTNNESNITQNINIHYNHLVDHGKEDLEKIDYKVFIEAMKKTGPLLFEKLGEGIHLNPKYPENQNIYISDVNREKCMIYYNNKWILENYNNIYPSFLSRLIEFGYIKEEELYKLHLEGKVNGFDIINNGMRWIKLLDNEEEDSNSDSNSYNDSDNDSSNNNIKMKKFKKKHNKEDVDKNIKSKLKNLFYNNKEKVLDNYNKLNIDYKIKDIEKIENNIINS